ncbi:hypothetical protein T492DRAFT_404247 [Pavlovales sp. CCMP2436]|nr:hypothetical protein T492DRAFT_404247 [Pavlovales sp. CCMP2436]
MLHSAYKRESPVGRRGSVAHSRGGGPLLVDIYTHTITCTSEPHHVRPDPARTSGPEPEGARSIRVALQGREERGSYAASSVQPSFVQLRFPALWSVVTTMRGNFQRSRVPARGLDRERVTLSSWARGLAQAGGACPLQCAQAGLSGPAGTRVGPRAFSRTLPT